MTGLSNAEKSKDDNEWLDSPLKRIFCAEKANVYNSQESIVRSMVNISTLYMQHGSDQGI